MSIDPKGVTSGNIPGGTPAAGKDGAPALGLECRRCGCRMFEVLYTRPISGQRVFRRRQCRHCGHRMTTVEHVVGDQP